MRSTGDWDGRSFGHEALCYADEHELGERLVPFVGEGLERGQQVAVVVGDPARSLLHDALGKDVRRLALLESAQSWWHTAPDCVRDWDRALHELAQAGDPFRVVGEPVWLATQAGRRWTRYEAASNRAWADVPCYCLCLHDLTRLAGDVVDEVRRSHPLVWDAASGGPVANRAYQDPADFVLAAQPAWRARPAGVDVGRLTDPRQARRALAVAVPPGWRSREDDVVLAAHELVINALREVGEAGLAVWSEGGQLVVEVTDTGRGLPDPVRGYVVPGNDPEGGRGLWVAWGLADEVAVDSSAGTRIRLFFFHP